MNVAVKEYPLVPGFNNLMLSAYAKCPQFLMVGDTPTLLSVEPVQIYLREERQFYLTAGPEIFPDENIISCIGSVSEDPIYWHLFEMRVSN